MLLIEPKFISICFAINLADTVAYRLRKIVSDIESVSYSEQNIFNLSHQEILEKDYGMIIIDARGSTRDSLHFCLNVRENAELDNILIAVVDDSSIESEEIRFLSAGADCYISTTMTDKIIKCRFNSLLRRYKHFIISRSLSLELEDEIKSKMKALQNFQNLSVIALTQLAGARDNETGKHIIRTQLYVKRLAEEASQGTYALQLNKDYIEYMFQAAPLHDIGKVGIPDAILKKPGRLTYEEMEIMKNTLL